MKCISTTLVIFTKQNLFNCVSGADEFDLKKIGEKEKGVYGANLFLLNFVLKCLECTMLGKMGGNRTNIPTSFTKAEGLLDYGACFCLS